MTTDNTSNSPAKSELPGEDLVRIDPTPEHFHTVRIALVVEGIVLAVLGVWGLIAALGYHGLDPTGAAVLVFRFTVPHAAVLLGTGVLAFAATSHRSFGMVFSLVQTVAYGLMFITSAGQHNSFSNAGDAVLHGAVAAVGLALMMWTAGRALDGWLWARPGTRPANTPRHRFTH
ncbi:MAG TPA: hypothetical protein VHX38_29490 [Pseudonocardiaceae bacterium]|jgi:hypothetical protein|nr:hypothetical protein [Pseudonocardiaceae bacterium]